MKKLITLLLISFLFVSCDETDKQLEVVDSTNNQAVTPYAQCLQDAKATYKLQLKSSNHTQFEDAINNCNKDFSTSYLQCSDTVVSFINSNNTKAFDNSIFACVRKHADTITYEQCMEAATEEFRSKTTSKSKKHYSNHYGFSPNNCVEILGTRINKAQCKEAYDYTSSNLFNGWLVAVRNCGRLED